MKELILGGARSGKSALAQQRAKAGGLAVTYIATARALDREMAERVARHREARPAGWEVLEIPVALAAGLSDNARPDRCLLVDCLTLWLSNLLGAGDEQMAQEKEALLRVLPELPGHIVLVSNEVGQGIVPANELARRFRDEAGWLHQALAGLCDRVTLSVAGLPMTLKDTAA
jgi:adenosylcobinamide kinase/adenosylcobinamide-phosphate guanylyltransferase